MLGEFLFLPADSSAAINEPNSHGVWRVIRIDGNVHLPIAPGRWSGGHINVNRGEFEFIGPCPLLEAAPSYWIVGFGHDGFDSHPPRRIHVAVFHKHIRFVAIRSFAVWINSFGLLIPLSREIELLVCKVRISDKERRGIVR